MRCWVLKATGVGQLIKGFYTVKQEADKTEQDGAERDRKVGLPASQLFSLPPIVSEDLYCLC